MAISRSQLVKELEPGLNALFGMEYDRYENEHAEIFDTESSDRAFEEEVMLVGFGNASTKQEGAGVAFDAANEAYTARYTHETIALAFALTEEAVEDNLYDRLGARYTRALARSMAHTKQIKAAAVLNNGFSSSYAGGDGKALLTTDHPLAGGGTFANEPTTAADLNETSLENALIDISTFVDERKYECRHEGGCTKTYRNARDRTTHELNTMHSCAPELNCQRYSHFPALKRIIFSGHRCLDATLNATRKEQLKKSQGDVQTLLVQKSTASTATARTATTTGVWVGEC